MPSRLVNEEPPDVVESCERVASLVEDGRTLEWLDPTGDDPERLACRVVVDRPELDGPRVSGL
jgi:hypothetical protein